MSGALYTAQEVCEAMQWRSCAHTPPPLTTAVSTQVLPGMLKAGKGTIIFTGDTTAAKSALAQRVRTPELSPSCRRNRLAAWRQELFIAVSPQNVCLTIAALT